MGRAKQRPRNKKVWQRVSDLGRAGLVVGAVGLPFLRGQVATSLRAALALGLASGASKILKRTVPEKRPDDSDRQSFPSDHCAETFAAATVLYNREAPVVGFAAIACACVVGAGRVGAGRHYFHDVAAGAVIGAISARV